MSFKHTPFGTPEKFNVVLEIPKGSRAKYEYDEKLDIIKLDFVFSKDFGFIHNYGYIPETRGGDGDHLDAFILGDYRLAVRTIIPCRAIGMIELVDKGEEDNKIIAAPVADEGLRGLVSVKNISEEHRRQFELFFKEVGVQKNKTTEIKRFLDKKRAVHELTRAHERYMKNG